MSEHGSLGQLAEELEAIADKLRSDAIEPDEAADLVERCADLAAQLGSELDERSRSSTDTGQERLL